MYDGFLYKEVENESDPTYFAYIDVLLILNVKNM